MQTRPVGIHMLELFINDEISGFHGDEYEDDCRLGCCVV
jgi:hypothetical protein